MEENHMAQGQLRNIRSELMPKLFCITSKKKVMRIMSFPIFPELGKVFERLGSGRIRSWDDADTGT